MKLIDKTNGDEPVHLPFDAAQAALASGAYEMHKIEGERGPDQPAAQMPKPGVDPIGGKEEALAGGPLTNVDSASTAFAVANGLPKEPEPPNSVQIAPAKTEPAKIDPPKPAPAK